MSNPDSLLPNNATELETAIEAATARQAELPVPLRALWNPDTCPAELLPWLAWALSLDTWQTYWPEAVKRQRIKQAIAIQRRKGTAQSVRDVVASFGSSLSLKEWWQNNPPTTPHTFEVLLAVGGDVPATTEYQNDILAEINRTKPVRAHFDLIAGITAAGGMGLQGAARSVVYHRLGTVEA